MRLILEIFGGLLICGLCLFVIAKLDQSIQRDHQNAVAVCKSKGGVLVDRTYTCVREDAIIK